MDDLFALVKIGLRHRLESCRQEEWKRRSCQKNIRYCYYIL